MSGKDEFWQPLRRIESYEFGKKFEDMSGFIENHVACDGPDDYFNEDYMSFVPTNGRDISISTSEGVIYAVTYRDKFYVNGKNFIGENFTTLLSELEKKFGIFPCTKDEDKILFSDGSIHSGYNIDDLGLEFTTDESGNIIYISAGDYGDRRPL